LTYAQHDYTTVAAVLRPSPERVATAKAWLAEKLKSGGAVGVEGFSTEFALVQGELSASSLNPNLTDHQDALIRYWQWALALRQAIYDFHRDGIIAPTATGYAPELFNTDGPRVPLGPEGEHVQPTAFPTTVLYREYVPSMLTAAEREHRLELYDADLFMRRARLDRFDYRVQRCVAEALASYRADLFLAAANMLGAGSEAAWFQIAKTLDERGIANNALQKELASVAPGAADIQARAVESLRSTFEPRDFLATFGFRRVDLDPLSETARYWRDQRNFGMHPAGELGSAAFTQAAVAVQMMGATAYFKKLSSILEGTMAED
jgi:hypothetical protein